MDTRELANRKRCTGRVSESQYLYLNEHKEKRKERSMRTKSARKTRISIVLPPPGFGKNSRVSDHHTPENNIFSTAASYIYQISSVEFHMESAQSTEHLASKMDRGNTDKMQLLLIVLAILVAVVALIVACVGIGQKGVTNVNVSTPQQAASPDPSPAASTGGSSQDSQTESGERIWTFAIGDGQYREAYIDERTGTLRGFLVDLVNSVCERSNKNCRIMGDLWSRCWDNQVGESARGGDGLMGRWYDACPGWVGTFDRHRTFQFTKPYGKADIESFFVKSGTTSFDWRDLTGKTVGILDGYSSDEHCLARQTDITGVPLPESQIIHYQTPDALREAVNNGDVDVAFALAQLYTGGELDATDAALTCTSTGPGLMLRVDNELPSWWNPALDKLLTSDEYKRICQDLKEEHGHQPGRDPADLCFLD